MSQPNLQISADWRTQRGTSYFWECRKMLLLWSRHTGRAAGRAAALLHLPRCAQSEAGNAQQQILPGKLPLPWPTVQLQNPGPSAILGPNPGNPEYSTAGTDTVGKWCGQAVKNTIAHLLFPERWPQGRTTSQPWALPRPLKLNSYKQPPGCTAACPVLALGAFRPAFALETEFQSIRRWELKESYFSLSPFFLSSFDYLFYLSLLLIEDTEFK